MRGLTAEDIRNIVNSYKNFERMTDIAKRYSLTRQRIWQVLKAAGVDTTKKGAMIKVICAYCGGEFKRIRCQVRKSKNNFCSNECYYAWLSDRSSNHEPWRHGMRIGRAVASKYLYLEPEYVVHHEDGNNRNNDVSNLKVFKNSKDHLLYHRGFNTKPIWEGTTA